MHIFKTGRVIVFRMNTPCFISMVLFSLLGTSHFRASQCLDAPRLVKDGFYKLTNFADGSALTATRKGPRPHEVITEDYHTDPTQQWKVKSKMQDGVPLQIIRNEQIRENEVTKEPNYDDNGREFIPLDWNFIPDPAGRTNKFVLFNGSGCLIGNGRGQRITISYCDTSDPRDNQLWEIEFLYKIPK